jgi:hypothetical protein
MGVGIDVGVESQAASIPTIRACVSQFKGVDMGLILLEALGALLLLILIVWWTMFSGRKQGELPPPQDAETEKLQDKSGPKP